MIEFLKSEGHNVINIRKTPLAGATDDKIYEKAVKDKRVIITMDKDFSRIVRFPPEKCGGIIVVKLYRMTVDETTEIFKRRFKSLDEEKVKGRLVTITREGIRIRTPREVGK